MMMYRILQLEDYSKSWRNFSFVLPSCLKGSSGSSIIKCTLCAHFRASKEFSDVHGLIMHAYSSQNPDLRVDHLGLHKAMCVLMGWDYTKAPENSKAYQSLSAADASANRDDLVMWPPVVIIHNTNSGKRKDGRMEGMGNKEMDLKLKDLDFAGGKSKSMYGKEGHLGITLVKYANTQAGLKEAERLADYFEKDNRGCKGWARAQAYQSGADEEKNPALVEVDPKSGEKKRIFYGYLATASDLDKVDSDTKKKAVIKSRREFDSSE
ncbi:uncharacterized protein LOC109835790 [Asparagus officinalis]|uniref:uncharacterized protein LOC109835790 n=1 Tax=Asparagus officinalis TaxID=4686 RepID=UPI00098E7058|nr:uncharacterized protein LOC109835790 [Asparagus officinalis]